MRVIINYLSISALRHKKQFSRKVADCWVSFQYRSFGSGGRAGHQPGRPGNEIQKLIILQIAPLKDCIRLRSASCAQTQSCMQTPTQLHRYIPYQQSLPITAFLEVLHRHWRCSSFPMLSRNECERMCSLDLCLLFPQTIVVLRQSRPGCPLSPGHFAAAVGARNANPPTSSDNKHH